MLCYAHHTCSYDLSPWNPITPSLAVFPVLSLSSPWLTPSTTRSLYLPLPINHFAHPPHLLPLWRSSGCSLYLKVCFCFFCLFISNPLLQPCWVICHCCPETGSISHLLSTLLLWGLLRVFLLQEFSDFILSSLEQHILNFNRHMNHLGALLKTHILTQEVWSEVWDVPFWRALGWWWWWMLPSRVTQSNKTVVMHSLIW